MQQRLGITAILVTHDQAEALSISDRVVVMSKGRIEEIGTPSQIYAEPHAEFTASFIGAMNKFPVRVVAPAENLVERDGIRFAVAGAGELRGGANALLLIRPESLEPLANGSATAGSAGPTLSGRVEVQTFLGSQTRLLVRPGRGDSTSVHGDNLIAVDVPSASAAQWPTGSDILVSIPPRAARVIASEP
jgi:putative spermidine/putrescine transport system ATP-binding protein